MKIIPIGTNPSGSIRDPITGKEYEFTRDEPVEVPESIGNELIARGDFKAAAGTKKESKTQ